MEKNEYYKMHEYEINYWWYRGLHELVQFYINQYKDNINGENLKIFDAGCGTGRMLEILSNFGFTEGIDYSNEAIQLCKERGLKHVKQGDLNTWQPSAETYDVIISNDVICTSGVKDDVAVMGKFYRALKKGGILISNFPAFKILRRRHDIAVFSVRRYRKKITLTELKKIGFNSFFSSYRLPHLFWIILFKKYLFESFNKGKIESDLKPLPVFFNSVFLWLHRIENWALTKGMLFPFGSSLFVVAKKN